MLSDFKCTLLREKFTMRDPAALEAEPVTASSNRMVINLVSPNGKDAEDYVIRTQNMHSCVRMAAVLTREYSERGAIMKRVIPFRWHHLWSDVIKGYERDWNPDIWCAVYYKGRVIFEEGKRHHLLDIIEKCDAAYKEDYDRSVMFAEQAFIQVGKPVKIAHESNFAMIMDMEGDESKIGIMLRSASKRMTFSFVVKSRDGDPEPPPVPTVLTVAAAQMEGIQLAYMVGTGKKKIQMEFIDKYSDEGRKTRRGEERIFSLTNAIQSVEKRYVVTYRPERPDFLRLLHEAEEQTEKNLRGKRKPYIPPKSSEEIVEIEQVEREARERENAPSEQP
ncbi:MAG: hypothetical protein DI626_02810 [Micavibrio aeruginosavorus]|uniref:Uncharacterized protein n=1 Tax=Micavibrio aeruginosavorus TaxID=349221 RepID=A0A2W5A0C6_9BACT|nr:MAG: hypothetical protein DI626_02810 [Micavibrio aeruginosavorus]